jgi:signal transduction histidine kinase
VNSDYDRERKEGEGDEECVSDTRSLGQPLSGRRPSRAAPARWPEELLALTLEAPVASGLRAAAERCIERIATLMPGYAVALRMVQAETGEAMVLEPPLPERGSCAAVGSTSRLFPTWPYESVIPLAGLDGSTLHVAYEDSEILKRRPEDAQIVLRSADVLSAVLQRARELEALAEVEQLRVRVAQSEKLAALGQVVANIVHEINNPLTSIAAYAEHLRRHAVNEARGADEIERLRRIEEAAERAHKFARDLVTYARPTTETPTPVALSEVINKALLFCDHEIKGNRIGVVRCIPDPAPLVLGTADHLVQVFVNLFTNAAQAMSSDGGTLTVAVRTAGDWAEVDVRDTGIGVGPESLERIFEPFYTTRESDAGTGLGLAIVHDIVAAHGGELQAHSTPGEGTLFQFTLPLVADSPSGPPRE